MNNNLRLVNSSVVFVAPNVSPGLFTTDYLNHKKIVSSDRKVENAILLPPLSQIKYAGGFLFEATESRIKLEQNYEPPLTPKEWSADNIGAAALTLFNDLLHLPYSALGINFRFVSPHGSLAQLTSQRIKKFTPTAIVLQREWHGYRFNLTLHTGENAHNHESLVLVDVNVHHDIPSGLDLIQRKNLIEDALAHRTECFSLSVSLVDEIPL